MSVLSALVCALSEPLGMWIPGAVFGALFGIVNFRRKSQIALYAALSSALFYGAALGTVSFVFSGLVSGPGFDFRLSVAGLLSGACAALALAIGSKFMSRTRLVLSDEIRSIVIGGIAGIVFVQISHSARGGGIVEAALMAGAYAVWQIPVGWSLTTGIQRSARALSGPSSGGPN